MIDALAAHAKEAASRHRSGRLRAARGRRHECRCLRRPALLRERGLTFLLEPELLQHLLALALFVARSDRALFILELRRLSEEIEAALVAGPCGQPKCLVHEVATDLGNYSLLLAVILADAPRLHHFAVV